MSALVDGHGEERRTRTCRGCGATLEDAVESAGEPTASDGGSEGLCFCGPACWHEWASRD